MLSLSIVSMYVFIIPQDELDMCRALKLSSPDRGSRGTESSSSDELKIQLYCNGVKVNTLRDRKGLIVCFLHSILGLFISLLIFHSPTNYSVFSIVKVMDSISGRSDTMACVDVKSNRIAFLESNGSISFFPNHSILNDMGLRKDIPNLLEFRYNSELKLSTCCKIWLWEYHENICVVDIDGTVTIEDVRGYVETVYLGEFNYIHDGIIYLLHKLSELKLRLLFLTSRPVDHIHETRKFLDTVQEEDVSLPQSPLFMSQDFVLEALYREVISRNGAVIKAGILTSIRDAFRRAGRRSVPFIMGFGNKKSDGDAYSKSGILSEYIFIIDTTSKLKEWEGERTYQSYRDPKLLSYIDASFRHPDSPQVFKREDLEICVCSGDGIDEGGTQEGFSSTTSR